LQNKEGKTYTAISILFILLLTLVILIQPTTLQAQTEETHTEEASLEIEPTSNQDSVEAIGDPTEESAFVSLGPPPEAELIEEPETPEEVPETPEEPKQVVICLVPNKNLENAKEITIEVNELPQYDNYLIGECPTKNQEIPQQPEQEQSQPSNEITGSASYSRSFKDYDINIVNRRREILQRNKFREGTITEEIKPTNQTLKDLKIKNIKFKDLVLLKDVELGIDRIDPDEIKRTSGINFAKIFAIDPEKLEVDKIEFIITAEGFELYKCKDWNFNEGICEGSWEKIKDITKGQDYLLEVDNFDPGFGEAENVSNCIGYLQNTNLYDMYNSPTNPCNAYKDFYVNKSGYQVTNIFDDYIAKQKQCFYFDGNVKCSVGENFVWNESTDDATYVNITGTLNKPNYVHKIRYHLNQDDKRLLIHQGVKNKYQDIDEFAFGYIHYDIKLNNDTINDFIKVDNVDYNIDTDVNITPIEKTFTLFDPNGGNTIEVDWLKNATIRVKNREVELYFGPVPFSLNAKKQVKIFWLDLAGHFSDSSMTNNVSILRENQSIQLNLSGTTAGTSPAPAFGEFHIGLIANGSTSLIGNPGCGTGVNFTIESGECLITPGGSCFFNTSQGGHWQLSITTPDPASWYLQVNVTACNKGTYNLSCSITPSSPDTVTCNDFTNSIEVLKVTDKNIIPTTVGSTPFYTTSLNPQTCSNLKGGDSCNLTWEVNATGDPLTTYDFFTIFDGIQYSSFVSQANTTTVEVDIT